jgi:hypothetical protein
MKSWFRTICMTLRNRLYRKPKESENAMQQPTEAATQAKRLNLDTALGNPINNEQTSEFSAFERAQADALYRRYNKAILRSNPDPLYNCHGLTFACRRTGIHDTSEIEKILSDDRYRRVSEEEAKPGDIILYFDDKGEIEHSGIILSAPAEVHLKIPLIVSKWGKFAEFLHFANYGPYSDSFARAQYFRIIR